jgi:glycosyltransferase involved in cell wall biosynthesis
MSVNNKNITFFTPTMKRTGSELVLFNLVNNLDSSFSAKLFSKYKGELLNKLNSVIKADYLYTKAPLNFVERVVNKLKKEIIIPSKLSACKNSIWYINTIILPEFLEYAKVQNINTIVHVHELEQMFEDQPLHQIETLIKHPKLIIANSHATEQILHKYGRTQDIKVCYPAIDTNRIAKNKDIYISYRKKLNISSNTFVWVMCGSLDKNKNPSLFIDIAKEVLKTHPNALFMWIGGASIKEFELDCKQKAASLNLSDKIIWITEPGDNYLNYFKCADGFVLTSKRESFSLVTIEALLLELPVVANNCVGVTEILRKDVGKIVEEESNTKEMANEMLKFMNGTYILDVEKGKQRAKEFDIKIWSKKWNEILNDYFAENV